MERPTFLHADSWDYNVPVTMRTSSRSSDYLISDENETPRLGSCSLAVGASGVPHDSALPYGRDSYLLPGCLSPSGLLHEPFSPSRSFGEALLPSSISNNDPFCIIDTAAYAASNYKFYTIQPCAAQRAPPRNYPPVTTSILDQPAYTIKQNGLKQQYPSASSCGHLPACSFLTSVPAVRTLQHVPPAHFGSASQEAPSPISLILNSVVQTPSIKDPFYMDDLCSYDLFGNAAAPSNTVPLPSTSGSEQDRFVPCSGLEASCQMVSAPQTKATTVYSPDTYSTGTERTAHTSILEVPAISDAETVSDAAAGIVSDDDDTDYHAHQSNKRQKINSGRGSRKGGRYASADGKRVVCRNCGAHQTPQWRCGPEGPRTLCNACGVRFKKGLPLPYWEELKRKKRQEQSTRL